MHDVKIPGTAHTKEGIAPAVLPAHEGQSINPHREAYEELACMAAAAELERERENEDLNRKMYPMTHELRDAVGQERLNEMSEEEKMTLYRSIHPQTAASAGGGDEFGGDAPTKRAKRWKQKKQSLRNKKLGKLELEAKDEQEKAQRRLEKQVGEVGSLLKGMQDQTEWQNSRKQYRQSLRAKRKELEATAGVVPKQRKIGGGQYAEEAAIVPDADAGAKGLRSMSLRSSAIRERLGSVVRRGLLPPPSEASKMTARWHKKKNSRLKRSRKFISPLLKDNLLLR